MGVQTGCQVIRECGFSIPLMIAPNLPTCGGIAPLQRALLSVKRQANALIGEFNRRLRWRFRHVDSLDEFAFQFGGGKTK